MEMAEEQTGSNFNRLGGVYCDAMQFDLPAMFRKAFALRERVSQRERYYIESRYDHRVIADLDKTLAVYRDWRRELDGAGCALRVGGRQSQSSNRRGRLGLAPFPRKGHSRPGRACPGEGRGLEGRGGAGRRTSAGVSIGHNSEPVLAAGH
jgi:hypothetical protein